MIIEDLDLETRSKIYNHTKKILRKYQKGIITGKLTADKFADNILSDTGIGSILNENIIHEQEFKLSYINYIETLIKHQNENITNSKIRKSNIITPSKPNITQQIQLKNMLIETDYELSIPCQYLTTIDIDNIMKYISTGKIDLGNERIYNYVHKIEKH